MLSDSGVSFAFLMSYSSSTGMTGDGVFCDGVENKLGDRTATLWMSFGDCTRAVESTMLSLDIGIDCWTFDLATFRKNCVILDWFVFVAAVVVVVVVARLDIDIGDTFTRPNDFGFMTVNGFRASVWRRSCGGDAVVDVTSFGPVVLNWRDLSAPTRKIKKSKCVYESLFVLCKCSQMSASSFDYFCYRTFVRSKEKIESYLDTRKNSFSPVFFRTANSTLFKIFEGILNERTKKNPNERTIDQKWLFFSSERTIVQTFFSCGSYVIRFFAFFTEIGAKTKIKKSVFLKELLDLSSNEWNYSSN